MSIPILFFYTDPLKGHFPITRIQLVHLFTCKLNVVFSQMNIKKINGHWIKQSESKNALVNLGVECALCPSTNLQFALAVFQKFY